MNYWTRRVLFYVGCLVLVTIMSQDVVRRLLVDLVGQNVGTHLYSVIRTNVEAPISAIFVALYLDVVLRRRRIPPAEAS